MAMMIRPDGLGKRVAYKLLGKPANMKDKTSPKEKEIKKRLEFMSIFPSK